MNEPRSASKTRQPTSIAGVAPILLLLLYAISLGPVEYVQARGWVSPDAKETLRTIYKPLVRTLSRLHKVAPSVVQPYYNYTLYCGRIGERDAGTL
jgi:hypothetical protein